MTRNEVYNMLSLICGEAMKDKVKILVAVVEPLLVDGIVNAVGATGDLEVVATPRERTEIIALLRDLRPRVAIIDFELLRPDVFQVIGQIKEDCEDIGILALLGREDPSCLLHCLRIGVAGYLLKTAGSEEVINAIRGVCAGEAVLDLKSIRQLIQHLGRAVGEQGYPGEGRVLSQRELQVLRLASKGLTNKEIARDLFVSERTIQSHFSAIFGKLKVGSRTEAVLAAWRNGWITNEDLVD